MRPKVLIVAWGHEAATAVGSRLEKDSYRALAARDGGEALDLFLRARPDILAVDQSQLKLVRLRRAGRSPVYQPVIVLAGEDSGPLREAHLGSGVLECVGRPVDPREVLCRVPTAIRSTGLTGPQRLEKMRCSNIVIDRRSHQVRVRSEAVRLTPTEFRLLQVLAGEPGRAFTRLEPLQRVFGSGYEGLEGTVDTHVKNLRKKIKFDPADPVCVEKAYGVGYRFAAMREGQMGNRDSQSQGPRRKP